MIINDDDDGDDDDYDDLATDRLAHIARVELA